MALGKGDPILEDFYCRMIPNAPNVFVYRQVIQGATGFPTVTTNPSLPLDYDVVTVEAYEAGLLHDRRPLLVL